MNELDKLAILCISREPLLLDILSDELMSQKLEVIATDSGIVAQEIIEGHCHRLVGVIVDNSDDETNPIDGFELRQKTLHYEEVPYLIISAPLTPERAVLGLNLKIHGFIEKPINSEKFLEQIEKFTIDRCEKLMEEQILTASYFLEGNKLLEKIKIEINTFKQNPSLRKSLSNVVTMLQALRLTSSVLKKESAGNFCHRFSDFVELVFFQEGPIRAVQTEILCEANEHLVKLWGDDSRSNNLTSDKMDDFDFSTIEARLKKSGHFSSISKDDQQKKVVSSSDLRHLNISASDIEHINEILGETVIQKNLLEKKLANIQRILPNHDGLIESLSHLTEMSRYQGALQEKLSALRTINFSSLIRPIIGEAQTWDTYYDKRTKIEVVDNHIEVFQKTAAVVYDCVNYLIRNAIEHGIESTEVRLSRQKPREGNIRIEIEEKQKNYFITIADDGNGINIEQLKKRLVERNIANQDVLDSLEEQEILDYIFASPEESSSVAEEAKPDQVGFAFLKQQVTLAGGQVSLKTEEGIGTTCAITLPKIKMSTSEVVVVVSACGAIFGIGQNSVARMISINHDALDDFFQEEGGLAYLFEENIISLVSLSHILAGHHSVGVLAKEDLRDYSDIVVVKSADEKIVGILVDNVIDSEEIVNRRLCQIVNEHNLFCGAAILGDSKLGLVIDVEILIKHLEGKDYFRPEHGVAAAEDASNFSRGEIMPFISKDQIASIMVFRTPCDSLFGIEHQYIDRVEFFKSKDLKRIGSECMAMFRGSAIKVLGLEDYLNLPTSKSVDDFADMSKNASDGDGIYSLITKSHVEALAFSVLEIIDTLEVQKSEYLTSEIVQSQFCGHFLYKEELVAIVSPLVLNIGTIDDEEKQQTMITVDKAEERSLNSGSSSANLETATKLRASEVEEAKKLKQLEHEKVAKPDEEMAKVISISQAKKPEEAQSKETVASAESLPVDTAAGWGLFD